MSPLNPHPPRTKRACPCAASRSYETTRPAAASFRYLNISTCLACFHAAITRRSAASASSTRGRASEGPLPLTVLRSPREERRTWSCCCWLGVCVCGGGGGGCWVGGWVCVSGWVLTLHSHMGSSVPRSSDNKRSAAGEEQAPCPLDVVLSLVLKHGAAHHLRNHET